MTDVQVMACLIFILLSPLAVAGLALIHQGLGRSRSASHAMLSTLCVLAVSSIVVAVIGAGFAGWKGGAFYSIHACGRSWDWLGNESYLLGGRHLGSGSGEFASLVFCLQLVASGIAASIPLSAGTDRWRLAPICVSTALFSAIIFPMITHWIWGGGWISQVSTNFGLGSIVDRGGAGVIHVTGGLTALSIVWILGPRRGKYGSEAMANAIPGHNIVLVLFGCMIAMIGWIALETATSLLFFQAPLIQLVGITANAVLSASSGCLASVLVTQLRYRKPDASLSANGWVAGLVAGSAGCGLVSPLAAIATGAIAGLILVFMVEFLELRMLLDDPGGAISVHAGAGIWGLLAIGLFAPLQGGLRGEQIVAQMIWIATLLGFTLPWIHATNLLLNRVVPYRVDRDGDWQGMDVRELGAGAYPEFVVHSDEFMPR